MERFNGILYGTMATLLISSSAVMAQDDLKQSEQQKQKQEQQDSGAKITLDRQAPEIQYTPATPKVSVSVPPPKVTVKIPPPQIEVTMPEPNVQIEQQEPKVTVEMGEPNIQIKGQTEKPKLSSNKVEPEINIQREGEPQIQVQTSDPEVTITKAKSQGSQQQGSSQQFQNLMAMTAKDIKGKPLLDAEEKDVGNIEEVVLSTESKELFAVIEGEQGQKVVPVSDLELSDKGDIQWSSSKDQLQQANDFEEQRYNPIVLDRALKEFQ